MIENSRAVATGKDACEVCGRKDCQWWHSPFDEAYIFAEGCDAHAHLNRALKAEKERDALRAAWKTVQFENHTKECARSGTPLLLAEYDPDCNCGYDTKVAAARKLLDGEG